jgi:hypothetical protein
LKTLRLKFQNSAHYTNITKVRNTYLTTIGDLPVSGKIAKLFLAERIASENLDFSIKILTE